MNTQVEFRISRKSLLLTSLLFVVLVSSLFIHVYMNGSSGASLENVVHVKNEEELRNAVSNAPSGSSTVIVLDNDIVFTDFTRLRIPANRDITFTSSKVTGYYKILRYITVGSGGVLRLDGVIVTNEPAGAGGVEVQKGGRLIMYKGEISGNAITGSLDPFMHAYGGGVCNYGTFEMYGGKISNNKALDGEGVGDIFMGNFVGYGGGVANYGTFKMFGGEISGNTARYGGGVYNLREGVFEMSGGEICNNRATSWGGGVYNERGTFNWLGGTISGNIASGYNDVFPDGGGSSNGGNDGNSGGSDGDGGGSDGDGGSSVGDNGQSIGGFGVRCILVVCVVIFVVMGVVLFVLFVYFQKRMRQVEKKINTLSQYALEV